MDIFFDSTSIKVIKRNHFTPYSMNKLVSRRVKCLGLRQDMRQKLDSFDRNKRLITEKNE